MTNATRCAVAAGRQAPEAAADRSRRARLPDRFRLEGLPGDRRRLRHQPAGRLQLAAKLPEPIFTPATKAEQGDHDENISLNRRRSLRRGARGILAREPARRRADPPQARDAAIATPAAADYAPTRNIIIADTKFGIRGRRHRRHAAPDRRGDARTRRRFWPMGTTRWQQSASYDKQACATT